MTTTTTHDIVLKRFGRSNESVRAVCACGWESVPYSRRTVEGARLAERDGLDHAAHMAAGPNRYCTNSCPHVTAGAR